MTRLKRNRRRAKRLIMDMFFGAQVTMSVLAGGEWGPSKPGKVAVFVWPQNAEMAHRIEAL